MSTAARHRLSAGVLAAVVALVAGTAVRAEAVTLATLELSTDRARAGDEVTFRGWYYNDVHPVLIHWETVDGPVLATVTPDTFGVVHNHWRSITGSLRIPTDASAGTHLLLASQDFARPAKITFGVPARAEIHVGDAAGPRSESLPAGTAHRPTSITLTEGPRRSGLLAAAVIGAALAGLLAVVTVVLPTRRARVSA